MRKIALLVGIISSLAMATPTFARDSMKLGNVIVPIGFCTLAPDGTVGVKLNGVTYDAWLLSNAISDHAARELVLLTLPKNAIELQILQQIGLVKKAAQLFQKTFITRGQNNLCRFNQLLNSNQL